MLLESAMGLRDELIVQMEASRAASAFALAPHRASGSRTRTGSVSVGTMSRFERMGGAAAALSPAERDRRSRRYLPAVGVMRNENGGYQIALRIATGRLAQSPLVRQMHMAAHGEVDIRVTGAIRAHGAFLGQTRARPVGIGYSVGHERATAGSVGCFVQRHGDVSVHLLSSNHVLALSSRGTAAKNGDVVLQPGRKDGGKDLDVIGYVSYSEPLDSTAPNLADAALCRLADDIDHDPRTLADAGFIAGLADPLVGDEIVEKIGRTTGHTRGRVAAFGIHVPAVTYPGGRILALGEQVEIESLGGQFSRPGDSGALIFVSQTNRAFALLNGGDSVGRTFCSPLATVFGIMGASLVE